jgi:BirA family transcriptional regulator, biotin operon repressor / biotin---[acetyl-CoA-carboxylase] ligase
MSEAGPAAGWRLKVFDQIPSTSDLCVTLARAGEPEGLAVLAGRQTAGRGSRGREWASPPGNLYLSVLLRPAGDATEAGRWALLAGVALAEVLGRLLPDPATLRLKWPNDLMLRGRKLAGILIDTELRADGRLDWLVIGLGANLSRAPLVPDRLTARLADAGRAAAPESVANAVLEGLRHWHRQRLVEGFEAVRAAWMARAHPLGTRLTVRHAGALIGGTFAGLDADGSLLLQTGGTLRRFATAEILLAQEE